MFCILFHKEFFFVKSPPVVLEGFLEQSLLYQLVGVRSDAVISADDGRTNHTLSTTNLPGIDNIQHIPVNTEGPELPQEIQPVMSLCVDGFTVVSQVEVVVQVNIIFK